MSDNEGEQTEVQLPFGKKHKHTLDSDEEDDELIDAEKYRMDDLDGMEAKTIEFDGEIKITPFNMDEELETGHFDKEGTYIADKSEDIRDSWLDNINWNNVISKADKSAQEHDSDDEETSNPSTEELYEQLLKLIRPGESIQKALQRFGKECPKVKLGKKRKIDSKLVDDSKAILAKENILKLTTIADKLLHKGDMDIYERKYEQFQMHLSKRTSAQDKESSASDDMFSDNFDLAKGAVSVPSSSANTSADTLAQLESTVSWQFKWEDKEDAPVYGPYRSEDMQAWVDDGHFKDGVFVRKIDSEDAKFYSSKRIDFDLYI